MNEQSRAASFWFMLIILGIGLLVAVTTIFVGHTISPKPLGFIAWTTIGFLCFVEFLFTILGVNGLVGRRRRRRPSGVVLVISYYIVGIYTAVGLVSIILYSVGRSESGSGDRSFMAILMAETVLAFVIVVLLYAYDFFIASTSQAQMERREHHAGESRSVRASLAALGNLTLSDPPLLQRREALVKKLQKAETALAHSHGGGIGSREGGWQHPADPAAEQAVDEAVNGLGYVSSKLAAPAEVAQTLAEMDGLANQLQSALDRLQLT